MKPPQAVLLLQKLETKNAGVAIAGNTGVLLWTWPSKAAQGGEGLTHGTGGVGSCPMAHVSQSRSCRAQGQGPRRRTGRRRLDPVVDG
jgi:hypothetical protein